MNLKKLLSLTFVFFVVITATVTIQAVTKNTITPQNTFTAQQRVENAAITFNDTGQTTVLRDATGAFTAHNMKSLGLTQVSSSAAIILNGGTTDTAMIDTSGQENLLNSINMLTSATTAITFNTEQYNPTSADNNAEANYNEAGTVLNLMKENTGVQQVENNINYNAANKEQQMIRSITAANNFTAQRTTTLDMQAYLDTGQNSENNIFTVGAIDNKKISG